MGCSSSKDKDVMIASSPSAPSNRNRTFSTGSTAPAGSKYGHLAWQDLPETVQKAARFLGFDAETWALHAAVPVVIPVQEIEWDELTPEQRQAAKTLGYHQRSWDE